MRIRLLSLLAITAFQMAIATNADAQFQSGRNQRIIRLGFGGGMSVPISDAEETYDKGFNGEAFILVNLMGLPLRFNIGYQKLELKEILSPGDASSQILSGTGGLKINLLSGGFRPYVSAGVGAFSIKTDTESASGESEIKFGIDGGAGIEFTFGPFDAFIEGRIQNIYTDQGAIDFKSIRVIPVSIGILF